MITFFRALRCRQLRTKWRLALWQYIDTQAGELLRNPEGLEKKILESLAHPARGSDEN